MGSPVSLRRGSGPYSPTTLHECAWCLLQTMLLSMLVCKAAPWILDMSPDLETLHNLRLVNRAFYSAYRARPLELIQSALRRSSPVAWELREMGNSASSQRPEQPFSSLSPAVYLRYYQNELYTVGRLTTILFRTSEGKYLSCHAGPLGDVVDALSRIWTFCRVFGGRKAREDDLEGQNDWFAGGVPAHEPSGARVYGGIGNSETIALAPECFGKGNAGGLSAEETIMILTVWQLLRKMLRQKIAACLDIHPSHGLIEDYVNRLSPLGLDSVEKILLSQSPLHDAWGQLRFTTAVDCDFLGKACYRRLTFLAACANHPRKLRMPP